MVTEGKAIQGRTDGRAEDGLGDVERVSGWIAVNCVAWKVTYGQLQFN